MTPRRLIATVVALAGLGAFGWGLYHLMLIGSCGGEGVKPCPPGSEKYFIGVAAGLPVAIVGTIAGGGALTFVGTFVTVGVASLAAGFSGDATEEGQETFLFIFGASFVLFGLAPLLLVPFAGRKAKLAAALLESGTEAIGTVVDVRDTGVTVNDNPRVNLRFRIEPQDGTPAFEAEKKLTVSRLEIPRVGDRYPIWFDPADRAKFAFGTDVTPQASPKVRRLFELAGRVGTSPPPPPPAVPAPIAAAPAAGDPYAKIAKLNELRMAGAITDEEFAAKKDELLRAIV